MQLSPRIFSAITRRGARALTLIAVIGLSGAAVQPVSAATPPNATGTIGTVSIGASNSYALTLQDAAGSPSPIGSVWAAWVPGEFFLTSSPTTAAAPAGWTSTIVGGSIQWKASSSAFDVPAGGSLSGFGFTTPDSPASVDGFSSGFPTTKTMTSVAYSGGLFSDAGTTFVFTPSAVPEPTCLAILTPAMILFGRRKTRTKA